jgi:hypothetical protein
MARHPGHASLRDRLRWAASAMPAQSAGELRYSCLCHLALLGIKTIHSAAFSRKSPLPGFGRIAGDHLILSRVVSPRRAAAQRQLRMRAEEVNRCFALCNPMMRREAV